MIIHHMGFLDKQLAEAIEQHHTEDAIRLLDKISDVNYQTHQRYTALHTAVMNNNMAVAAVLLQRGASMNILPKNKAYRIINQSPMLLALQMGESHEDMQLLFLCHLKIVRDTWKSKDDARILEMISRCAMLYSSPRVFFEATRESGAENLRDAEGISHLMHMIKSVTLLCTEPEKCKQYMHNVLEIVDKYPGMAWERLERLPDSYLGTEATSSTALGMLVFNNIHTRHLQNLKFVSLSDDLKVLREALFPNNTSLQNYANAVEIDEEKNVNIMAYLKTEFIPDFFTMMLRPMRVALAMATHMRLGSREDCWAKLLNTDIINMIFNVLIRDIVVEPSSLKAMLY